MPTGRLGPAAMLGLLGAATLASLVLLNNAEPPFVWIGLVWVGLCGLLMRRGAGRHAAALWFNVGFVALVLLVAEAWAAATGPSSRFEGDYADIRSYVAEHEVLGYAPHPGIRRSSRKIVDDTVVYDVAYTIDEHGLRRSPPVDEPDGGCLVFFGGSFTFGEGVDDDETLPYRTGLATAGRYRVYNFGFHGYGPHQMLAALEQGLVGRIVGERVAHAFYLTMPAHVQRAAGKSSWDLRGPRYALDGPDGLVRRGTFAELGGPTWLARPVEKLGRSHLVRRISDRLRGRATEADLRLYLAIVARARDLAESDGGTFHVLVWDAEDSELLRAMLAGLEERGIRVLRLSDVLGSLRAEPSLFVLGLHDAHPNPRTYAAIAEHLASHVVGRRPT